MMKYFAATFVGSSAFVVGTYAIGKLLARVA